MPDPAPAVPPPHNPPPKERPKWGPPVLLAIAAFSLGLFGDLVDAGETVTGWFRAPPLPKVSEEYLMIEVPSGVPIEAALKGVMDQVAGLRIVVPDWLDRIEADTDRLRDLFCTHNEFTMAEAFAAPDAPERAALIEDCKANAEPLAVLIGTYALRSFDPKPLDGLKVDLALLKSPEGWVDGYDGFVSGALDDGANCFRSGISDECTASRDGTVTLENLPVIGPGEMIAIPIFLLVQFSWTEPQDENHAYDGLVAAPFTFPAKVRLGDRVLIETPRPMNETPSLRQGFYEGRG